MPDCNANGSGFEANRKELEGRHLKLFPTMLTALMASSSALRSPCDITNDGDIFVHEFAGHLDDVEMGGVHGDSLDRCRAFGVLDGLVHVVRDGRDKACHHGAAHPPGAD
jgi:hypothetical protein